MTHRFHLPGPVQKSAVSSHDDPKFGLADGSRQMQLAPMQTPAKFNARVLRDDQWFVAFSPPDVKGFDFALVVIVGCGSTQLPNPGHCWKEAWRYALRLYVAMTRARDEVVLIYAGRPSEFLNVMREGLVWNDQGAPAAEQGVHDNIY